MYVLRACRSVVRACRAIISFKIGTVWNRCYAQRSHFRFSCYCRLTSLPTDLGGSAFEFLYITESCSIARTSSTIRGFVKEALLRPRPKAICRSKDANKWFENVTTVCPRIHFFCDAKHTLEEQQFVFSTKDCGTNKIGSTIFVEDIPEHVSLNMESLCVSSLSILDIVQDRKAQFPNLKELTVKAFTTELHCDKAKDFLSHQWADIDITFEHDEAPIGIFSHLFYSAKYILPSATMRINIQLTPLWRSSEALTAIANAAPDELRRLEIVFRDTPGGSSSDTYFQDFVDAHEDVTNMSDSSASHKSLLAELSHKLARKFPKMAPLTTIQREKKFIVMFSLQGKEPKRMLKRLIWHYFLRSRHEDCNSTKLLPTLMFADKFIKM